MKKKSGLLFRSNVEMRYFRQMLKKNLVIFLFVMLIVLPVSVYSCISLTRNELNNVSSAAQIAVNSVSREVQSIFDAVDALGSESDFKSVNTLSFDLELKNNSVCIFVNYNAIGIHAESSDCILELFSTINDFTFIQRICKV